MCVVPNCICPVELSIWSYVFYLSYVMWYIIMQYLCILNQSYYIWSIQYIAIFTLLGFYWVFISMILNDTGMKCYFIVLLLPAFYIIWCWSYKTIWKNSYFFFQILKSFRHMCNRSSFPSLLKPSDLRILFLWVILVTLSTSLIIVIYSKLRLESYISLIFLYCLWSP